jgi:regulator of protease activity HflC (stomatin/prohibitin superfamily)
MKKMAANESSSWQRRLRIPAPRIPTKRILYSLFMLMIASFYWFFAWKMERIDLAQYELPYPLPLPQIFIYIMTFFLPRVLRHFIPVLIGWLLAYEVAANLLFYLYDLPDHSSARSFLFRLRSPGRSGGNSVTVTPQTLERQREESARIRAGGPGRFIIPVGHAAVTEHNGRYYRTLNAGDRMLDNFEHIHAVLDLRPQHRNKLEVLLQSREGLEVTTDVSVTFRISTGNSPLTPQQPFPYDPIAVRKLAYSQVNLPENRVGDWEDSALGTVISILRKTVVAFSLDELLQDSQTERGAHFTIRRQVEREARDKLRNQGINLQRVRIGRFDFPDDVTSQHIAYWRTYWDSQAELAKVDGEARALEEMEVARAEAEMETIKAIVDAVQQARQQGFGGTESVVVALRIIEALERLALQSQLDISLPDQMLNQLRILHQQLLTAGNQVEGNDQNPPGLLATDEGSLT